MQRHQTPPRLIATHAVLLGATTQRCWLATAITWLRCPYILLAGSLRAEIFHSPRGLAVQHWGEPRFTRDVDMTLLTGFGNEEPFVHEWLAHYESRMEDPVAFALANRVLLLRSAGGIGIDIAFGGLPFEEDAVELEHGALLRI